MTKTEAPEPQGGPPRKPRNAAVRKREYLKREEVDRLRKAANQLGRHGERDSTLILIAFRHGLRVKELVSMLDWHQVDFQARTVFIRRCKGSKDGEHTLEKDEIAALRRIMKTQAGPIFTNERGGPLTESGVFKIIARAGEKAGLGFAVHPHMLRHACGYDMTKRGLPTRLIQDWLGHKNIQHTVRYTELDADKFRKTKMW